VLFVSAGQFQNQMTYDPVGLINTSIAAVIAAAAAMVLWAILAPQTPEAARRRFVRAARKALARIASPRARIGLAEFETAMTEALEQLRGYLRDDRHEDIAIFEAGLALLGAGRDLIRMRESPYSSAAVDFELQIAKLAGIGGRSGSISFVGLPKKQPRNASPNCARTNSGRSRCGPPPAIWAPSRRWVRNSSGGGALLTHEKYARVQSDAA
jgi:hypothetical protein